MNPIRLTKEVTIKGPNLWGLKAKLTFSPLNSRYGWVWQSNRLFFISINPSIVDDKAWGTRLYFQGKKLQIFEHIGVLHWFGLCGLSIRSSSWPPYYGRSLEFWQAIKPYCEEDTSKEINWYTLRKPVRWTYPKPRNNQIAFTEIRPNTKKELKIEVTCNYSGMGAWTEYFSFPDDKELEQLCAVYNQGWPPILYYLLKVPPFFGWPHHKTAIWVQERGKGLTTLRQFIKHRAADLLGTLSLLCRNDGLLSANVTSVCSGHKADIEAVLQANELLYQLE
ncbi:UDP-3-O-acyl-N-acetylglucosamine deacetylase [Patescibacteria group bacterium]|nr:UDP-3-O-acyl-N-acetylglucosamine deacetylase [Patescibacteria group bacterium]